MVGYRHLTSGSVRLRRPPISSKQSGTDLLVAIQSKACGTRRRERIATGWLLSILVDTSLCVCLRRLGLVCADLGFCIVLVSLFARACLSTLSDDSCLRSMPIFMIVAINIRLKFSIITISIAFPGPNKASIYGETHHVPTRTWHSVVSAITYI